MWPGMIFKRVYSHTTYDDPDLVREKEMRARRDLSMDLMFFGCQYGHRHGIAFVDDFSDFVVNYSERTFAESYDPETTKVVLRYEVLAGSHSVSERIRAVRTPKDAETSK